MDKSGSIEIIRELNGTLSNLDNLSGELSQINTVGGQVNLPTIIYPEHSNIPGRDVPNQHPVSAITGLEELLETFIRSTDNLILDGGTSTEVIYEA